MKNVFKMSLKEPFKSGISLSIKLQARIHLKTFAFKIISTCIFVVVLLVLCRVDRFPCPNMVTFLPFHLKIMLQTHLQNRLTDVGYAP